MGLSDKHSAPADFDDIHSRNSPSYADIVNRKPAKNQPHEAYLTLKVDEHGQHTLQTVPIAAWFGATVTTDAHIVNTDQHNDNENVSAYLATLGGRTSSASSTKQASSPKSRLDPPVLIPPSSFDLHKRTAAQHGYYDDTTNVTHLKDLPKDCTQLAQQGFNSNLCVDGDEQSLHRTTSQAALPKEIALQSPGGNRATPAAVTVIVVATPHASAVI